jgi:hypothetical protein
MLVMLWNVLKTAMSGKAAIASIPSVASHV